MACAWQVGQCPWQVQEQTGRFGTGGRVGVEAAMPSG